MTEGEKMDVRTKAVLIFGAFIIAIGVVGSFQKMTRHDGALAIAGALLVAAVTIASAIEKQKSK